MSRIFEITEKVQAYTPKADIDLINRAYVFAAQAHKDQRRSSGDLYMTHPLAVANILASLKLDVDSIVTALLHDTVEDTHVTLDEVRNRFGDEVARLVDGVTKIGQIQFRSSEHKQAENFRKMILATAQDLRVLLIKLADRLHNMRTLGFMREEKRRQISEETMELYAPLAHRLGIHWIKQEMEDLAFSHLESDAYRELLDLMKGQLEFLHRTRENLEGILQEALDRQGIKAQVYGRMKHLYSIHDKMQRKHVDFSEIYDLIAFRVIVGDTPACYHTLGIIHSLYRPVPGRFKDYIALPKPNGYQSLHTSVIGPDNHRIEIQIRTASMHSYAEDGVAAHWLYKNGGTNEEDHKHFQWLKQLTELLQQTENPGEFMESARLDLFVQEVYVFSRDGDIYALPRGAKPLDFAYAVHTDVGHHCMGIRINGEVADFRARIRNGDQIEVLTNPDQTPSRQWLQYVKTPRARQAIRQWFRRQERDDSIRIGERILKDSFGKGDLEASVIEALQCSSMGELKEKLGRGEIPLDTLLGTIDQDSTAPLQLKGMSRSMTSAAACCHPIPGDPVLGYIESGKGMVIHHRNCPNIPRDANNHWLEVNWGPEKGRLYPTGIEVRNHNQRGMLANVSATIAEAQANIEDLKIEQRGGSIASLKILVEVEDRDHLAKVLRNIKALDGVVTVSRRNQVGLGQKSHARGIGAAIKGMVSLGKRSLFKSQPEQKKKE
ncbi:MAG: bifunctional (p)ppGpp synthetase/guanosine-3',5'-bis(diphosphate) 3'-pyrophosphohydrolase [Mariprofundaceae bacterium]|nr:bifunctional (p)ppGpp synthetase/guanosine-3',5'-bis(diphosphate) 3'-pyrophosphohydrolase [Mariprofundaceae bacterium]